MPKVIISFDNIMQYVAQSIQRSTAHTGIIWRQVRGPSDVLGV